MNRYRVRLPLLVHLPDGTFAQGDEFEHEFSDEDEQANVSSGLLEVVPVTYRVIGGSNVHGANPGETFEMGLLQVHEALLIAGGHIERVDAPGAVNPTPSKSKES